MNENDEGNLESAEPLILRKEPQQQKKRVAKENVERGKEHVTATGRIIPAKIFKAQVICKCEKYCSNKIDVLRQNEIFNAYYAANYTQKTFMIRSLVRKEPVSSKKSQHSNIAPLKERNFNFNYTFLDDKGISQKVCRDFFINCLSISATKIHNAINSEISNPTAVERRGRAPPKNKTTDEDKENVVRFIRLFPKYESHYSREKSQKQYLGPNLNLTKLYNEYKNTCEQKNNNTVSIAVFTNIFKSFKLRFKQRHSDTCKSCDGFNCILKSSLPQAEKEATLEEKRKHMDFVEKTCSSFRTDVHNAAESGNTIVLTFDLQKTLETPSLTTSVAYYSRQLWTFNLCIYDEIEKKGYMYVWNESIASRGGQEIASCLLHHLRNKVPPSIDNAILYSDSCGGQNRNIKVALLLKHFLLSSNLKKLQQKFFIPGHSYNSCDRCFSLIEKAKKLHDVVATPDDWVKIIKEAKRTEPKFEIKVMESADFFSSAKLEHLIVNRKKDLKGRKVNWMHARNITQERDHPFLLIMKNDEAVQEISLQKKNIGEEDFKTVDLALLYPFGKPITKQKYLDLMQLITFIPYNSRQFFKDLIYDDGANMDYGFASGESDAEDNPT